MKRLIVDLDDTISVTTADAYAEAKVNTQIRARLREYRELGFEIVIHSARNMRTYEGQLGKINANTLPIIIRWLDELEVPYDEIIVGKPWCGFDGFYIDDKAVRPDEFAQLSYEEIVYLLAESKRRVEQMEADVS